MVQFNFSERTIKAKVVYYGPAQSGKTTNLEQIHLLTDPAGNNRLISLNTAQDRTLFFDLLPFSLGAVSGYDFKVQLYTIPGQVQYNATRRVVLAGADAVVFVADSRKTMFKENLAAFENMKVNLLANRLVPEKVPLVLQYNKRDLSDIQDEAEMNKALNPWGRRAFPAIGSRGEGVLETFVAVVQEMLSAIAVKYNLKEKGLDPASVAEVVSAAFSSLLDQARATAPAVSTSAAPQPPVRSGRVILSQATDADMGAPLQATPETGLVSEELLHRAIRSNVDLAEALAGVVREMNEGLGTIAARTELLTTYPDDAREKRLLAIGSIQQEAARLRRVLQDLGTGGAGAAPQPPARTPAAPSPPPMAPRPPAAAPPAPPPAAPETGGGLDATLRETVDLVRPALQAKGQSIELRVPAGVPVPRAPAPAVQKAVSALLHAVSAASVAGLAAVLRCERKPVLLRARDGAEVKRDFLMLAIAHDGSITAEQQQRALQGTDGGPLGDACRLVRELGGFVRFAPLPGGGLETRAFLPIG